MKQRLVKKKINQKPVRIAVVMGMHVTGGIKSVIMNYYKFIDRDLIQFDFIVDDDSPIKDYSEIYALGGRVFEITSVKNPFKNIYQTFKILKKNQYLCLHGYINTLNVFPMFAGFLARTPVRIAENLSTSHPGEKKTVAKNILKPFAKMLPTHIAANSKYAAEWIYGNKGAKNCKIIYNALDLNKFRYDMQLRDKKRKELGVENCFVIGHIGRYQYQKNHVFLIDIFNSIYQRDKSAILLLVGYGELKEQIFDKIDSLGLRNVVIDCGATEAIMPLYNAMDCFVLPSYYEGLPVVGIEAQATGLPCVMSTEITKETKITDNVNFMSLNESSGKWADVILKWENHERCDVSDQIRESGYDIRKEAGKLQNYYFDCLKETNKKNSKN